MNQSVLHSNKRGNCTGKSLEINLCQQGTASKGIYAAIKGDGCNAGGVVTSLACLRSINFFTGGSSAAIHSMSAPKYCTLSQEADCSSVGRQVLMHCGRRKGQSRQQPKRQSLNEAIVPHSDSSSSSRPSLASALPYFFTYSHTIQQPTNLHTQ